MAGVATRSGAPDFRRDYRIGGRFYFNVDGEHNIANAGGSEDGLTQAERIELLTHRCFIDHKAACGFVALWRQL